MIMDEIEKDTSLSTLLPPDYSPGTDEEFMNPIMQEYFRLKLIEWREELISQSGETIHNLQEHNESEPDVTDQAVVESQRALELRTRERSLKLIHKIDEALTRIKNNEYGYCVVTGETISVQRLDARPIATMTLKAQEAHEKEERLNKKANPLKDSPI